MFRLAAEMVSKLGEERPYTTILNLDEKEIPRDNVVLNRLGTCCNALISSKLSQKLFAMPYYTMYNTYSFVNQSDPSFLATVIKQEFVSFEQEAWRGSIWHSLRRGGISEPSMDWCSCQDSQGRL